MDRRRRGPDGLCEDPNRAPAWLKRSTSLQLYTHGAGWVFGDAHTHDRLVRDLAIGAEAAVVFPEYDRSPEAKYPVALEQSYAVAQWITTSGAEKDLDSSRIAVAGDSVGGNMAIALTLLAKERGDVSFVQQVEFYPVTDANFDTPSYQEFADGYFLTRDGMKWYWDQFTTNEADRAQITASPLRASVEQLEGLPPALIIKRRGGRTSRRGRGIRGQAPPGECACNERPLRRNDPRLRDAQCST